MQRIKRLQKLISSKKIEAFLITHRPNLKYLCNFGGTRGMCLITPKKAFFLTDARYFEEVKKILPRGVKAIETERNLQKLWKKFIKSIRLKKCCFEEQYLTVGQFKFFKKNSPRIKWKGAQNIVETLRAKKEKEEINLIKQSQKINEKVLHEVKKHFKKGITEKEISRLIKKFAFEFGADETSFRPIVAFGNNSSVPHHEFSNRKLKKGDIILIDMGMRYKGYCSDMTRVFFFKQRPTGLQEKIYNLVLEAQKRILNKIQSEMSGKKADSFARKFMEKNGYAERFLHNSGHGIGLEIHEIPSLSPEYKNKLPAGSILTVEPGIYLENSFGVRIEDMIILHSRGIINITKFPKNLNSAIIRPLRSSTGPYK